MARTGLTNEQLKAHNVALLFHTSSGVCDGIINKGFDMRRSKIGSFGRGCYLADTPSKASFYFRLDWGARPDHRRPFDRHMFACIVALGPCRRFPDGFMDTRMENAPKPFLSVVGNVRNGNEICVYDDFRILISHKLYYTGGPDSNPPPPPPSALALPPPSLPPPSLPPPYLQGMVAGPSSVGSTIFANAMLSRRKMLEAEALAQVREKARAQAKAEEEARERMRAQADALVQSRLQAFAQAQAQAQAQARAGPFAHLGNQQLQDFLTELVNRVDKFDPNKGMFVRHLVDRMLCGFLEPEAFVGLVEETTKQTAPQDLAKSLRSQLAVCGINYPSQRPSIVGTKGTAGPSSGP